MMLVMPCCCPAVLLLAALWVLLTPTRLGARLLAFASPFWAALLLVWLLAAYGATALAPVRQLPPVGHADGCLCILQAHARALGMVLPKRLLFAFLYF